MDGAEDLVDKLLRDAHSLSLGLGSEEQLVIPIVLNHSHIVLAFVVANSPRHIHTLSEQLYDAAVDGVDMEAVVAQRILARRCAVQCQRCEELLEHSGRNLLLRIAKSPIWRRVALDHKTRKAEVEGLLRELCHEGAVATYMAGIRKYRHSGNPAVQLDGHRPMWRIAVGRGLVRAEATMHSRKPTHTTIIHPLDSTHPEVHIGDYGVLDDYRRVDTTQGIGNLLHSEGVCRGAGTYPHAVNVGL